MKKKSTQLNESKLARYSAVAGTVLASGAVNAQIVYNDVNPDAVIDKNSGPYAIDFTNDANDDVLFAVFSAAGSGTYMYGYIPIQYTYQVSYAGVAAGSNAQLVGVLTGSSSTFSPVPLNNGDVISAAANFGSSGLLGAEGIINASAISFTYPIAMGDWLGATDKFLGVKFAAGANTHYGWVRLDVAADASTITIKDWAYNSAADNAINAGQMLNLENVSVDNKVTIKTQLDEAFVNVTPDLVGGMIAIVNMAGQEIRTIEITDINTNVKFDGLETGIYMLNARFESGSISKKFYAR